LTLVHGSLPEGWQSDALGLTVLTDSELFGWRKVRRPARRSRAAARDAFLSDLEPGELVVHIDHGIARFRGLITVDARADSGAPAREFLLLEYDRGDRLYVPIEQSDRVSRYVGGVDERPNPTKLGTQEWSRAKARAQRAVRDIARDLLELYAAREVARGHAFTADGPWQRELEDSFPYVETPDQLQAVSDVKADMERPRPMDRLLVGDVGYGKTEVALRAAFKAVMDGRQVAVLVPTTVLAQQHFATFKERFEAFPVKVEMLSRFRSDREQRQVVEQLAEGAVDVCIGTHRLVQKDVRFKNLGLVIVDEEQRFGVGDKERLKQLRKEVDVLTLTATPIPRTLHMSLAGVRDMSAMETAPEDRLPIRTYVAEYDEGLIREVILREIDRGGQIYFVHNRVQTIEFQTARLRRLVPEARFCIGHGQMPEDLLEQVMVDFANGDADVLVCTTIIESGLDIPNVNTIIVNNAHRFGLAQLYQLRGRVGRGSVRAYGYFLYARDTQLTEQAEQRLRTIFEATELGAGFRIAMKDLEIRGAGNLLGAEQSGHIAAVGFDLYTRLLGDAVTAMRDARDGVAPRTDATLGPERRPALDLPIDAMLPTDYVDDEASRLNLYQRLAATTDGTQLGELVAEIEDRFGPLPEQAQNLVFLVGLRLQAQRVGVGQISAPEHEIIVAFRGPTRVDATALGRAVGTQLRAGSNQVRFPRGRGQAWLATLQRLIDTLPEM
jgi:transcription-repair coupling factor (superfamily II helicase)